MSPIHRKLETGEGSPEREVATCQMLMPGIRLLINNGELKHQPHSESLSNQINKLAKEWF